MKDRVFVKADPDNDGIDVVMVCYRDGTSERLSGDCDWVKSRIDRAIAEEVLKTMEVYCKLTCPYCGEGSVPVLRPEDDEWWHYRLGELEAHDEFCLATDIRNEMQKSMETGDRTVYNELSDYLNNSLPDWSPRIARHWVFVRPGAVKDEIEKALTMQYARVAGAVMAAIHLEAPNTTFAAAADIARHLDLPLGARISPFWGEHWDPHLPPSESTAHAEADVWCREIKRARKLAGNPDIALLCIDSETYAADDPETKCGTRAEHNERLCRAHSILASRVRENSELCWWGYGPENACLTRGEPTHYSSVDAYDVEYNAETEGELYARLDAVIEAAKLGMMRGAVVFISPGLQGAKWKSLTDSPEDLAKTTRLAEILKKANRAGIHHVLDHGWFNSHVSVGVMLAHEFAYWKELRG